ncbi:hypothetical protein Acid345_1573 [Candidatus Koribacter versatilis Ellin345]|uniref:Tetratricopeptide repeat protein n=1 Tax=Koribacter versatilis (strain Ellin345) TaxID=204669 RepID=Q1IRC5_KORVE|nr:hypothetical protein [Candidatus Koribacter versatilis]ABF40575.1 hypothetical protein Acid345_1573 [Candidatus Koribacter versatilis Ellin345]
MNRTGIVAALILLAGMAGTVASSRQLDKMTDQIAVQEVLYLPSANTVKAISLGYDGLMADIYWTRVVQYFGRKHLEEAQAYKLLPGLLDITTTLDPHLVVAYQFGAFFLSQKPPQGAGSPDAAIALVKKGIENNPEYWRLYYDLGFIYWLEKKDPKSAADAFEAGSKVPGAQPWMRTMAASMATGANDLATARTLWTEILNDTKDQDIRANAIKRLMCVDSDEVVIQIQKYVDMFKERSGHSASSMRELVDAGIFNRVPVDPTGRPYEIDSYGRVVVKDPKALPFITQGLPHGQEVNYIFDIYAMQERGKRLEEEKRKKEAEEKSSGSASRPNNQQ